MSANATTRPVAAELTRPVPACSPRAAIPSQDAAGAAVRVSLEAPLALPGGPPEDLGPGLEPATTETLISCSPEVVILAVTPWRYVWQRYARATADRWS